MKMKTHQEFISDHIVAGYKVMLFVGILLLAAIFIYRPLLTDMSFSLAIGVPLLLIFNPIIPNDLSGSRFMIVSILILMTMALLVLLSRRKIIFGKNLMKNVFVLFGCSLLLVSFLPSCLAQLLGAGIIPSSPAPGTTIESFVQKYLPVLLNCPLERKTGIILMWYFILLILILNLVQSVAHAYYYARVTKNMKFLPALSISLLSGVVMAGIIIWFFIKLAGLDLAFVA